MIGGPVFDMKQLMNSTFDDLELAGQVVAVFLNDIPAQLDELDQALSAGDAVLAERVAHTVKGAAATVGGEALRNVAHACEVFGHEGALTKIRERTASLRHEFAVLRDALLAEGLGKE